MSLDETKRRITLRTVPRHLLEMSDDEELQEGEKKHHTPKFVQHCVTAITEKPESLSRVEKQAPKGTDGSPFGICWAQYKKHRRSLAAKHSQGKHHTVKQYEGALAKLREETDALRKSRPSRSRIVFETLGDDPKGLSRRKVVFSPE
jgi:hypothetical protein